MKRTVLSLLSIGFIVAGMSVVPARGFAQAEDELTIKARALIAAMEKGDFRLAVRDFDETMLKVSGPEKLEPMWKTQLPAQLGAFKKQGAARRDRLQGYDIVLVTCEFEKATLDARVVFDKAGKITGLFFVPTAPPVKYEPPAYADPAKFEETEVTVGSGAWALPGTLTVPKGEGEFPAVVLVHGSGPNTRDEELGPNKPFRDLAWGLASRGIAVLRYDKRSKVYGAKILADPKSEAAMTIKDETIDDALAAAALLKKTPKIDARRIFILGHSLGGFLLPRIALAAEPLELAGFISMAGLARPLEETIVRQMEYIYGLAGTPLSDANRKKLDDIKSAVARIKALTDADKGSTARLLGAMPAYWLDLRGYNPPEMAKSVKKPMLFLQGGRDYQVQTADLDLWKAALGNRKNVEFRLYPKLNHLFFAGEGILTPLEYTQKHGSVAEEVVTDIADWIERQPASSVPRRTLDLADPAYRNGVLQKIAGLIESRYVLADKAKGFADAFRAKCASGAYDAFTDAGEFAERVNADLIAITSDKHTNFRVMIPSDVGEQASGSLHHSIRYARLRLKENTGFYRLDWIEPGVGYFDLRRFYSFDQARDMAIAAMTFLAGARAIIIDIRENGGGSGDYLSSYFLPYPTQLSGSYSRESDSLTEIWTTRNIGAAPRLDVPVFILTGPNTFSAAESFAYDMQSRKRATLIGEPTKGGAHSVDLFGIDSRFEIYLSTERAVSPVTGENWEGTGVIPDIRVPAASALETAVVEAKKAAEAYGREKDASLKTSADEMQFLADRAEGLYREGKTGVADAALDSLVRIAKDAGLLTEFFLGVFAYNFQSPRDERMRFAILERNIRAFPNSPSAYELMATVCVSAGKDDLARKYFRKVLELDPGNRNAARMIRKLGGTP